MNKTIFRMWLKAKTPRTVRLGPVSIRFSLSHAVRVSSNRRRRLVRALRALLGLEVRNRLNMSTENRSEPDLEAEVAIIVGVGPGMGYALARKLSASRMRVALVARNAERLDPLADELTERGGCAQAYGCDATNERSVQALMALVIKDMGAPSLIVYCVENFPSGHVLETEVAAFEEAWRNNCLGAFIVGREGARSMVPRGRGTIILTGGTSSMIARAGYANLAVGKFGLRALAQAMAREFWPQGVHVTHLIVDSGIKDEIMDPMKPRVGTPRWTRAADLAELVYFLHRQPRSAWTHELDARPFNLAFWEHC